MYLGVTSHSLAASPLRNRQWAVCHLFRAATQWSPPTRLPTSDFGPSPSSHTTVHPLPTHVPRCHKAVTAVYPLLRLPIGFTRKSHIIGHTIPSSHSNCHILDSFIVHPSPESHSSVPAYCAPIRLHLISGLQSHQSVGSRASFLHVPLFATFESSLISCHHHQEPTDGSHCLVVAAY